MESEQVVERQLAAYNARNLDAFMACWAAEARMLAWPDAVIADGAVAIRERHRLRLADPLLHAELLSRIAIDELVIDRESVTRLYSEGQGTAEVIGIYDVCDGLIRTAWFKQGLVRLEFAD